MEQFTKILLAFGIVLVLSAAFAGCSDSSATASGSGASETTAATTAGPLFSTGDIVQSSSGTTTGWLVLSYDSAADSYTRAFIHQNADGSWGYRSDDSSETISRTDMEKVYTKVVEHVSVSSVPTQVPTTVPVTTATTAKKTTTVATTVTTTAPKPVIKDIEPEDGIQGESVTIIITGSNFVDKAVATLERSGTSDIEATDNDWDSSTQMSCTFEIPDDAEVGIWSIVVTNPDKKTGKLANYFMVHENSS